jgi:hypothetical protein
MPLRTCDILIQAGHQNTPDDATGGSGPLGDEIDWTPIISDEAVAILKAAGVDAVKEDASISTPIEITTASWRSLFTSTIPITAKADLQSATITKAMRRRQMSGRRSTGSSFHSMRHGIRTISQRTSTTTMGSAIPLRVMRSF